MLLSFLSLICTDPDEQLFIFLLIKTQVTHIIRLPRQQQQLPGQAIAGPTVQIVSGHFICNVRT